MLEDAAVELDFDSLYDEHFAFVWRNLKRLGVAPPSLDDASQDVFVVVHKKLADADVASPRAWLYAIVRRVAADHRRTVTRKGTDALDAAPEPRHDGHASIDRADAARTVARLLARLDDDKREVFTLAELEQWTAPEIATALGIPLNTVYSRLRAARTAFQEHAAHLRAEGKR